MQNPFSSIGSLFSKGLKAKPSETGVLGIDISSTSIKAVQLKKERARAILETYGEIFLGPYGGVAAGQAVNLQHDQLVQAFGDLIKGANITAHKAAIAMPLRSSLITLIELPSLGESQINEMIPIEARKYIPVPISEVSLDWWVIPKRELPHEEQAPEVELPRTTEPVPKIEVLMVAIHNSAIKQSQDAVVAANLTPASFEIETFSSLRSVLGREMSPTMILDLGASSSKITIVDYGIVRLSHVIARGAQDITLALSRSMNISFEEAEQLKRTSGILGQTGDKNISGLASPVIEYIMFEAGKVLANYQRKYKRAISKAILVGGGALLGGIEELAARSLEVEVERGKPFNKVEAPVFLEGVLNSAGPEFAVAIGVALRQLQES